MSEFTCSEHAVRICRPKKRNTGNQRRKRGNIYFCLELELKDTSTQGHRSPGVLNKSTQINEKNVVTPTLEHSSAIQGK